jgi:hemoglobin
MRHMPFHINAEARERWLVHMTSAIASLQLSPLHEEAMLDYVDRAAHAMTNQPD